MNHASVREGRKKKVTGKKNGKTGRTWSFYIHSLCRHYRGDGGVVVVRCCSINYVYIYIYNRVDVVQYYKVSVVGLFFLFVFFVFSITSAMWWIDIYIYHNPSVVVVWLMVWLKLSIYIYIYMAILQIALLPHYYVVAMEAISTKCHI